MPTQNKQTVKTLGIFFSSPLTKLLGKQLLQAYIFLHFVFNSAVIAVKSSKINVD